MMLTPDVLETAAALAERLQTLGADDYLDDRCRPCAIGLLTLVADDHHASKALLEALGEDGRIDLDHPGLDALSLYCVGEAQEHINSRACTLVDDHYTWTASVSWANDCMEEDRRPAHAAKEFRRLAAKIRGAP